VSERKANALGFGVIGTGAMARAIAGSIGTVDGAQLRAVGGRDPAKAAALARESSASSCSIDELLKRDDIDVIYVATPNHLHHEHVARSLEAGKHVVCEKPFMTSASQVRDVMQIAQRVDRFCMEAMWMRFTPAMRRLRELVRSGAIGEVRLTSAQMGYPYKLEPGHRLLDPAQGGGVVLDLGVYLLSLAFDVMGRPLHVGGALRRAGDRADGIDTTMTAILDYGQGRSAHLFASFEGATSNDATIVGPGGTIRVEEPIYRPPGLRVSYASPIVPGAGGGSSGRLAKLKLLAKHRYVPALKLALGRARIETPTPGSGYQFQLAEAVDCIRGGKRESSIMPLAETLAIHEAMDNLRKLP
jgi:predicted dehydrogenase